MKNYNDIKPLNIPFGLLSDTNYTSNYKRNKSVGKYPDIINLYSTLQEGFKQNYWKALISEAVTVNNTEYAAGTSIESILEALSTTLSQANVYNTSSTLTSDRIIRGADVYSLSLEELSYFSVKPESGKYFNVDRSGSNLHITKVTNVGIRELSYSEVHGYYYMSPDISDTIGDSVITVFNDTTTRIFSRTVTLSLSQSSTLRQAGNFFNFSRIGETDSDSSLIVLSTNTVSNVNRFIEFDDGEGSTISTVSSNPNSTVSGNVGSLAIDNQSGVFYFKVSGSGNSGWRKILHEDNAGEWSCDSSINITSFVNISGLTTSEINSINTSSYSGGEMTYNTTLNKLCYFDGTNWRVISDTLM